ncbi:tetratricopeptide repeat protein, partial [bacterium]
GVDYATAVPSFERLDSILRARAPSASESSLYYSYFDYAELLLVGTENQKALKCIDRFIETSPDYYEMEKVYNARGVALFRIDQYEKAADSFKKAMAANPDYMAPRVNLRGVFLRVNAVEQAMLSHRLGNYEAALKQVDNLLIIATSYLPALRLKGDILRDMGRDGEALDYYQSIVAENPEDPITYGVRLEMARILERQGELKGALEVLGANASRFSKVPNDPTRAEIIRIMDLLQKKP